MSVVGRGWQALVVLAAIVLTLGSSSVAWGHDAGISNGTYSLDGGVVSVRLVFSNAELATSLPTIDTNTNGSIDTGELVAGKTVIEGSLMRELQIASGGRACLGKLRTTTLTVRDGVAIELDWSCPEANAIGETVTIHAGFIERFASQHRHLATLIDRATGSSKETVLVRGGMDDSFGQRSPPSWHRALRGFFVEGVEHILTGYDHLAFLLGLLILGGRARPLIYAMTAFTIGHSISLALAVLRIWSPSARFVEPAIALSIAYIGVENWIATRDVRSLEDPARWRWLVTLPFGLIHGFGFAGALTAIELPRARIPIALAGFNLGVEAGQLLVLAMILPLVFWAKRRTPRYRMVVRAISAGLIIAGAIWFWLRVRG